MTANTADWSLFHSPGQGIYCHLTALNHLATSKYQAPPNLFTDPAFTGFTSTSPICSSNLGATSMPTAVFLPERPDGFGLPYGIHDNRIVSSVTSYPACNNHEFVQSVTKYLKDIFTVLEEKPLNWKQLMTNCNDKYYFWISFLSKYAKSGTLLHECFHLT